MTLDPNRWTTKTQEAFSGAMESARHLSHPEVTPNHLLAALVGQPDTLVLPLLQALERNPSSVRSANEAAIDKLSKAYGGEARMSRELLAVMDSADEVKTELGDKYVSACLLYTSPSPRDATLSRMPSSA